jgi:hypothetical protein
MDYLETHKELFPVDELVFKSDFLNKFGVYGIKVATKLHPSLLKKPRLVFTQQM